MGGIHILQSIQNEINNLEKQLESARSEIDRLPRGKREYTDYQSAVTKWEQQTGNKVEPDSLKAKLQRKTQEVKERENNRQSYHYRNDKGAR